MLVKEAVIAPLSRRSGRPVRSGDPGVEVGQDVGGGDLAVGGQGAAGDPVRWPGRRIGSAGEQDERGLEAPEQLAQLGWGWEVLLLRGHRPVLDAVTGCQPFDHLLDQCLRGRRPGRDPDGPTRGRRAARRPR